MLPVYKDNERRHQREGHKKFLLMFADLTVAECHWVTVWARTKRLAKWHVKAGYIAPWFGRTINGRRRYPKILVCEEIPQDTAGLIETIAAARAGIGTLHAWDSLGKMQQAIEEPLIY